MKGSTIRQTTQTPGEQDWARANVESKCIHFVPRLVAGAACLLEGCLSQSQESLEYVTWAVLKRSFAK